MVITPRNAAMCGQTLWWSKIALRIGKQLAVILITLFIKKSTSNSLCNSKTSLQELCQLLRAVGFSGFQSSIRSYLDSKHSVIRNSHLFIGDNVLTRNYSPLFDIVPKLFHTQDGLLLSVVKRRGTHIVDAFFVTQIIWKDFLSTPVRYFNMFSNLSY